MSALSSLLVRDQIVGVRRIEEALQRQVVHGGDLETNLLELGAASEDVLAHYRAQAEGLQAITAADVMHPDMTAVRLLTPELVEKHRMLPLRIEGTTLLVAVANPPTPGTLDELSFLLSVDFVPRLTTELRLAAALAQFYGIPMAPRLARLAQKIGPISQQGVLASQVVAVSGPRIATPKPGALDAKVARHVVDLIGDKQVTVPEPPVVLPPVVEEPRPVVVEAQRRRRDDETERVFIEPRPEAAPVRRRRRAVTPGIAAELLVAAQNRDEVMQLLVEVARQTFDYVAVFVVQDDAADGRLADGEGASTAVIRNVSVSLAEPSVLRTVQASGAHYLGPMHDEGLNHQIVRDLGRPLPANAVVLPVSLRSRVVLLMYGECGRRLTTGEDIGDLLALAPLIGGAFQRLIMARKFTGYGAAEQRPGSPEFGKSPSRPAVPVAAATATPVAAPTATPIAAPTLTPVAQTPVAETPVAATATPAAATETPATRSSTASGETAALVSPPPSSSRAASDALLITAVHPQHLTMKMSVPPDPALDGRWEAETPPVPRIGLPASAAPAPREADGKSTIPMAVPPAATEAVTQPVEIPQTREVPTDDEEDEEVSVGPWQVGDGDERLEEIPGNAGFRDTDPYIEVEAPPRQPPELGPVSGASGGRRRSRPDAFRIDVVSQPPGSERPVPSVIVDMGPNIEALVDSLIRGGEEGDLAAAALQKIGEAAIPALIQRFPGPLRFDRHEPHTRLPRVGECGAILRLLPSFRRSVVPYLIPLLTSTDQEVRFYGTFLFSELQYPEAIGNLAPLLYDDDYQTRILAIDVLKGFRRFPEFEDFSQEVRKVAWDASMAVQSRRIAVEAIGELRDAGAVALLIELLGHEDGQLSELCWRALVLITRQDFGQTKKKWQSWLAKEGARHHIEWLIDALVHPSPELRLGASEELKRITKEYFGYYHNLPRRERERARKRYLEWWERVGRARFTGQR